MNTSSFCASRRASSVAVRALAASSIASALLSAGCDVGAPGRAPVGGGGASPARSTVVVSAAVPVSGSGTAVGMSYWNWVRAWGDQVAGTEGAIAALHPGLLRVGGTNNDTNSPEPFTRDRLDEAVAYARAVGAEPIVQVPLLFDELGNAATPDTAASMVDYLNVTKGYGIRYFSIGNEPDLYPDDGAAPPTYTASTYCASFRASATAMRAVDPTVQFVGPDLSWKYQSGSNDWLTPFLQECADQVDIVGVHRYPIQPDQTTIDHAMSDAAALAATIDDLRAKMASAGAADKPLAISETNITWNGDPAVSTLPASPGTFPAGLWVADVLGVAIGKGLWAMTFWSISEDYTLGFITPSGQPRPAYQALRLYADRFGPALVSVDGAPPTLGVYASRTSDALATQLIVVNRAAADEDVVLRVTGTSADIPDVEHRFPGLSLSSVRIPDTGSPDIVEYTESDWTSGAGPHAVGGGG
jgi:hypothetical protein